MKNKDITLTGLKDSITQNSKNYVIIKLDGLESNIMYQVDNGYTLDMMIGSLTHLLNELNKRNYKEIKTDDN